MSSGLWWERGRWKIGDHVCLRYILPDEPVGACKPVRCWVLWSSLFQQSTTKSSTRPPNSMSEFFNEAFPADVLHSSFRWSVMISLGLMRFSQSRSPLPEYESTSPYPGDHLSLGWVSGSIVDPIVLIRVGAKPCSTMHFLDGQKLSLKYVYPDTLAKTPTGVEKECIY